MAGSVPDSIETSLLNLLFRNTAFTATATVYVALTTTNPTDASAGTEVTTSGTAYARQSVTFGAPSGGATSNTNTVTFPVATANYGTVEGFELYDASTSGTRLAWCDDPSVAVNSGQQAQFAIGSITISAS